jgi:hypothetical protein
MRSIHLALIAFALSLPVAGAAQSPAAPDTSQPAPKKGGLFGKKGGLFGKAKALTQNKLVQTVAKTAVCNMVPGGQLVAGALDKKLAAKAGKEAAAGAAFGAATGKGNPCGGMGLASKLGMPSAAQGVPGAGIPGMPTTAMPGVGMSADQMKQVAEQYRKMGMKPEQIKAMQQQMLTAAPSPPGAVMSADQLKQMQEQYRAMGMDPAQIKAMQQMTAGMSGTESEAVAASVNPSPSPTAPALSREKDRLVLRQLPWVPGSEAIVAGAEPVFAQALGGLAATMVNGAHRYKVEVRVENQNSGSKGRQLAQRRVAVVIAELVRQGMPQARLVPNDGGSDKDPRLVISETK